MVCMGVLHAYNGKYVEERYERKKKSIYLTTHSARYLQLCGHTYDKGLLRQCKRKPAAATTWATLRLTAMVLLYTPSHRQNNTCL